MKEYKSVEQRVADSYVGKFCSEGLMACRGLLSGLYGGSVSGLRIPTVIRKIANKQTRFERIDKMSENECKGFAFGGALGLAGFLTGAGYAIDEALKGNYLPAAVIGTTNLLSGIYELGRFSKSREEYKEVHVVKIVIQELQKPR
jgi:hypothetical protein